MRRILIPLGLTALLATASGCFELEQSIVLNRDLSGTAEAHMLLNMGPQVMASARLLHQVNEKTGEPSQEEIDTVAHSITGPLEEIFTEANRPAMLADGQKRLPEGIEFRDIRVERDALKLRIDLAFGFDQVSKVSKIQLAAVPQQAAGGSPTESPFAGFQVKDEGATLLIVNMGGEALPAWSSAPDAAPNAGKRAPEASADPDGDLSFDHLTYRLEAPFEVLETNATRREGKVLIWDLDAETIKKTPPEVQAKGFWVRYKR